MRWGNYYSHKLGVSNEQEAFDYFVNTLKTTNRDYDYFVDWQTVQEKVKEVETEIHLLDVLIGKPDIHQEAVTLFQKYPKVMAVIPILIAVREKRLSLLTGFDRKNYVEQHIEFNNKSDPHQMADFLGRVGFLKMLSDSQIRSVMDYVTGVEVGLGSNGRKNRGGKAMEHIIGVLLGEICTPHGWTILPQATKAKISSEWRMDISIGNANKIIDFAVKTDTQLFLIETNFYSGGGSKLKSTANEYSNTWNSYGFPFIWITDGKGWANDQSLRDAFREIDHILNIDMIQKGLLEAIIKDHIDQPTTPISRVTPA